MVIDTRVTFRGTEPSPALRTHILDRAQRLEHFAADIESCDVVVDLVEGRHRHGNRFDVHAHVVMRGRTIDATNSPAATGGNEDAYLAVSEVFDVLRRRVEDYVRRRRGDTKSRV